MKRGPLSLKGLRLAPAQVWGGVRLLPLIRDEVPGDLRLALRRYGEDATVVDLGGKPSGKAPGQVYSASRTPTVGSAGPSTRGS